METRAGVHGWDRERDRLASVLPAYEIGAVLGRGSFAVVYAARHRHLDRDVAIKRLSPELLRSSEGRERFAAEARLLASLDHPHIVRVHDYVEEEDLCAFVMERMPGGTLANRLVVGRPARAWSCAVMLGALHGLEHAHRHGALHRDVKPENLLFGDGELVKVADFGIAKVVGAQGARMTATAAALGTPAYMAPEQVTRTVGPLSSATDVWAAGAVLYEMLSGQPPFGTTGELGEVLLQRVSEDAPPLRDTQRDVPEQLGQVVMRALARDPGERYPTPGAFAADLEAAAGDLAATHVPIHRTPTRDAPEGPTLLPEPPRRRRRWVAALAGAAVVVAAALAVVLLAGGGAGKNAAARTLPPAPRGWPDKLTVGFIDQVTGIGGAVKRVGRGGTTFTLYGGDIVRKSDWSHDPGVPKPAAFVRDVARARLFPYISFNVLRPLGQTGKGDDSDATALRQTLADRRLMGMYWRNVRKFLQQLGSTGQRAAVSLDSNFWSYIEQSLNTRGDRPSTVPARVGLSGLPELRGIFDNLLGIAAGWRALRDRYAPKVVLGYAFDDWAAAGIDISRDSPPRQTVLDSARQAAEFYLTVAANDMDFAALTINGLAEEGQNPTPAYVYSRAEKESVVAFVKEFVRVADVPMVLEGVPLGNTVTKAITDKKFHWRDSWVQWLVGTDRFAGMRELHDAGVVGVMFGVSGGEDETCPCDAAKDGVTNDGKYPKPSTSADDDGGYFADRMAALREAGGLPVR